MRLKSWNSSRGRGITAALILLTAGTGAWWAIYSDSDATNFPETLCNHRISGDRAEPLLPHKGAKPQEETYNFDSWTSLGHCIIKSGGDRVSVTYEDALGEKPAQNKDIPVSLGDAYGYLSPGGGIEMYLSCRSIPRSVSNKILIGASASIVQDKLEAGSKLDESTSGLSAFTAFTAQAIRDLTQNWFKCPGADKLPDGPVTIHWDKPVVR